eukprot:GHVN01066264.1.p1 GENE.GHVN01066264.1~~GHVN01066264.1.p1  ORF type:complete len:513 (-),score=49.26 GHVN01066264.1:2625-4163(-)
MSQERLILGDAGSKSQELLLSGDLASSETAPSKTTRPASYNNGASTAQPATSSPVSSSVDSSLSKGSQQRVDSQCRLFKRSSFEETQSPPKPIVKQKSGTMSPDIKRRENQEVEMPITKVQQIQGRKDSVNESKDAKPPLGTTPLSGSRSFGDEEDGENDDESAISLLEPDSEPTRRRKKSPWKGLLNVFRGNLFLSALLLFIPAGYTSYAIGAPDSVIFSLNFIAIMPIAWLLGKATEDLAEQLGQVIGGLLNATCGNIVEMLVVIAGLRQNQVVVVRCTLVGSILSNLLLVTGCAFLFGGIKKKTQEFSTIGASTNASLMTLSCLCLGLPTMYGVILDRASHSEMMISRSVSILLAFIYLQYLVFQLRTHAFLFVQDEEEEEDTEEPDLTPWLAGAILTICTVLCTFSTEYLVDSISGVVDKWNVSREFIGIILLPIIGNAAEHYTAIVVATKDKMDLSLAVAVGSSCQMALFVTPFAVLSAWALGVEMTLNFHPFEVVVLLLSVLIMTR